MNINFHFNITLTMNSVGLELFRLELRQRKLICTHPGDLRFPSASDFTTKLNKHVCDQFVSGHSLLDSHVSNQMASEAVFCTKTGVQRALGEKSEACET